MELSTATLAVGGGIGLLLAIFGVRMLSTGRAPAATTRAFRTVRDAGMYHLLFGVALALVVLATELPGRATRVSGTVLAVALVGVAIARYRPRGRRMGEEKR
jgi:xanthine/uracil/vitamin C permease (AzgA family)